MEKRRVISNRKRETVTLDALANDKLSGPIGRSIGEVELSLISLSFGRRHVLFDARIKIAYKKLAAVGSFCTIVGFVFTNWETLVKLGELMRKIP